MGAFSVDPSECRIRLSQGYQAAVTCIRAALRERGFLRITISTSHSSALRKPPRTGEGDRGSVGTVDERSGSVVRGRGSGRACMKRKGSGIPRAGRGAGRRHRQR